MKAFMRATAPYAAIAALALLVWSQRGDIARQESTIKDYGQVIERQASDIEHLGERMDTQRLDLALLERTQDEIRNALDQRTFDLERLKNDDPEIRRWADAVLPDPVARLRQRPAITGAAAYAEYLRTRDPVQPAGGGAAN